MSTQTAPDDPSRPAGPAGGQWKPTDPKRARTGNQKKRELRKDHRRRRRILERAQGDPTLTHLAVRVLGQLLSNSDDTAKRVWPKMITVAVPLNVAVRSARRCVAELETAGYLMRYMRPVAGAMNASNLYYFREPAGPIPEHRPEQRRRPRMRSPHRGTLETGGTPKGLKEPTRAGAAQPVPPTRKPGYRRDLPPSPSVAAQPPRFVPTSDAQDPSPPQEPTSQPKAGGPDGPQRRPASGGPGIDGGGGERRGPERPADEAREVLRKATEAAKARSPFQLPRKPRRS